MLDTSPRAPQLPAAPGVGYKPQHFQDILNDPGPVGWLEVHAENYMGDGAGPSHSCRICANALAFRCTASASASVAKPRSTVTTLRV